MNATGRGGERRKGDYYPTPSWVVRRLLAYVNVPTGTWLEPGAGDGSIIRAVSETRQDLAWAAVEMDPGHHSKLITVLPSALCADFLRMTPPPVPYTGALGNPPFSLAAEFIEHALSMAEQVIFNLRLAFLETDERQDFFKKFGVPDTFVLPERPSYTGDGNTDSAAYAWMRWKRGGQPGMLRILYTTPETMKPKKERKARAA